MRNFTDYSCEEGRRITAESISRVEMCVMDMVEDGFLDHEIATALGFGMMKRLKAAFPDKKDRNMWLSALTES